MKTHIVKSIATNCSPEEEWGIDEELFNLFEEINNSLKELGMSKLPIPGGLYYKTLVPKQNSTECGGKFFSYNKGLRTPDRCSIVISVEYRNMFGLEEIRKILLHEMIHYYVYYHTSYDYHDNDIWFNYYLGFVRATKCCKPYFVELDDSI